MSKLGKKQIIFVNEYTQNNDKLLPSGGEIVLKKVIYASSQDYFPADSSNKEGDAGFLQRLDITGPNGTQSILIPCNFDLDFSTSLSKSEDNQAGGNEKKYKQVVRIKVTPISSIFQGKNSEEKEMWGTLRALLIQMLKGVTTGFSRHIRLTGIGYKAFLFKTPLSDTLLDKQNKKEGDLSKREGSKDSSFTLALNIGYSKPVHIKIPNIIKIEPKNINNTSQGSLIEIKSTSLNKLNNFAFSVYKIKPADKSFKKQVSA